MSGYLKDGEWHTGEPGYADNDGAFKRWDSEFRNWVTPSGDAGPDGQEAVKAEAGRYHLYVSLACPWAHRTLIVRKLKGLEDLISVSVTHWLMLDRGWTFDDGEGVVPDPHNGAETIHELYQIAKPDVSGKATVPILWDTRANTIVNNESADIVRILNTPSTRSERIIWTCIRKPIMMRSTRSMTGSTKRLITACISQALQQLKVPMKRPLNLFSKRLIGWREDWKARPTLLAIS